MSTREDLIDAVSLSNPDFSREDIKEAISIIFEHIESYLLLGHRIEIRGFGSFCVKLISLPKHSYAPLGKNSTKTVRYSISDNLLHKINYVYQ